MPIKASIQKQLISAIAYFIVTVFLATLMQWNMVDIAWSIWLSSFILALIGVSVGNMFFYWLLEIDEHTEEQKASPNYDPMSTEGNIFSSLYMFLLQLLPLVWLNSAVVLLLNDVLPFPYLPEISEINTEAFDFLPDDGLSIIFLFATLKEYWLFVLISLFIPVREYYQLIKQKMYKEEDTQTDLLLNPHYDVFKIQGQMLLLMVLGSLTSDFLVYWVLLLFYFFPWGLLWDWTKVKWKLRKRPKNSQ